MELNTSQCADLPSSSAACHGLAHQINRTHMARVDTPCVTKNNACGKVPANSHQSRPALTRPAVPGVRGSHQGTSPAAQTKQRWLNWCRNTTAAAAYPALL